MSNETTSANKRLYFRLRGEINCLKRLVEAAAAGDFIVRYEYLVKELRAVNSKLAAAAEKSRKPSNIKPQQHQASAIQEAAPKEDKLDVTIQSSPLPFYFHPTVTGRLASKPEHTSRVPFVKYRRVSEKIVDGVKQTYVGKQPFSPKALAGVEASESSDYMIVLLPGDIAPVKVEYVLNRELMEADAKGAVAYEALYIYMPSIAHPAYPNLVKIASIKGARVCTCQ